MTVIKTRRLVLRPIRQGDAARFAELCNDREIAHNTTRIPMPYTARHAKEFTGYAAHATANGDEFPFAVCREGEIIACAGLTPRGGKSCELGYWVGADYRGRGIASEAAGALTQFAFDTLGAETVAAGYFPDNPASGRVLEKLGFLPTGETALIMSIGRGCEVDTVRMKVGAEVFQQYTDVAIMKGGHSLSGVSD